MTTAEFQKEFLSNAKVPDADTPFDSAAEVVADYVATRDATLQQARDLGVGEAGAREVRGRLAKAFVRRWMMLRYAAIDLSFTKRPWWIRVDRNEDELHVVGTFDAEPAPPTDRVTTLCEKVNRFFYSKVSIGAFAFGNDEDDDVELKPASIKLGTFPSGRRGKSSFRSVDVFVSAALPDGISAKHVRKARAAYAHYYIGVAALYAKGIDLNRELVNPDRYGDSDIKRGRLTVFWAPLQHALSVTAKPVRPKGDPAIVLTIGGESFLLDFFDTPDEAPIEHLVREFTEGRLR